MTQITGRGLRLSAQYALAGGAITGLLTLACVRLGLGLGVAASVYLLIVVLQSLTGDFFSAAVVSGLAAASLDFFFTEPIFTFGMSRPSDVFALVAFLITALVITQLVSRLRVEIQITRSQKERLDHLYQLSQQLLSLDPQASEEKLLEPFRRLFGITAIAMFDGESGEMRAAGESHNQLIQKTRDAYLGSRNVNDREAGVSIRCLQRGSKVIAAIGFESGELAEESVGPLAALTSVHYEKMRAFRTVSAASAATQAEVYRSAILDALAHEFKTPLATILAAAGGLREAGPLGPEQMEMADTVESEVERLSRLTSRLLRTARLDQEEVRPRIETIDLAAEVRHMVDQYSRRSADHRIAVVNRGDASEAAADPQLLRLALSQLLDNACKYSPPGSPIEVVVERNDDGLAVEVSNSGGSISASEQRLIFERFYRGSEAKLNTAGSGLGLYVARKIALAHGGNLYLAPEDANHPGVTFRLKIPDAPLHVDHVTHTK
jgi:two-component system, OmpR family, sensor histidine kinase KdpD